MLTNFTADCSEVMSGYDVFICVASDVHALPLRHIRSSNGGATVVVAVFTLMVFVEQLFDLRLSLLVTPLTVLLAEDSGKRRTQDNLGEG